MSTPIDFTNRTPAELDTFTPLAIKGRDLKPGMGLLDVDLHTVEIVLTTKANRRPAQGVTVWDHVNIDPDRAHRAAVGMVPPLTISDTSTLLVAAE